MILNKTSVAQEQLVAQQQPIKNKKFIDCFAIGCCYATNHIYATGAKRINVKTRNNWLSFITPVFKPYYNSLLQ